MSQPEEGTKFAKEAQSSMTARVAARMESVVPLQNWAAGSTLPITMESAGSFSRASFMGVALPMW